ncbi:hypothetical protein QN277_020252 [Acacia crassicarpa]|uniref:Small ribosomal subunit protein uS5c n=1 Tax=Acacia crassicarpa TaxID=499986 RepID=A0AAE1JL46_9FABA|nr:hypothetical protein QN277_020252 [Acacia crassicarpa]
MAASAAALSSLSSLSLPSSSRFSLFSTAKFTFSLLPKTPQPFLSTSSSPIIPKPKSTSSDDFDTSFFDNVRPEEDVVFNPPEPPEGFVPPPPVDDGPMETEEEIAAAYEELYGPAFSGVSVLGNDVYVMDSKLKKDTGFRSKGKKGKVKDGFEEKIVQIRRVTKVVQGGKKMTYRIVMIVGNKKGQVGVGVGKAMDVSEALQKSAVNARRNIITVPMTKYLTFPHRSEGDYGAAKVMLRPASPGTGVIAGGSVRIVLEMAGVENALGKQLGSDNALNNARATVVAVQKMRQFREVAEERETHRVLISTVSRYDHG